ncbi:MAG TPA: AzlD domain-containing protein [Aestuariivirga sp.]|nr:AzlD domain-containing protein [Aestuariivirga sp.]
MPPAILMAVIAPTILTTGLAESIAAVLTAAVAFMRAPLVVTVLTGVISVVLLRMVLS